MYCSSGRPKAAVLPVPVWAWPMMSRPCRRAGIVCSWIGVGFSSPRCLRASRIGSDSPRSANVVTRARLAARVEHELAGGPPTREVLVGATHLRQRVDVAELRLELAKRGALEQIAQRFAHHRPW